MSQQQTTIKITIPAAHPMVAVLGHGDGILRVVEKQLPSIDIHVRGNEITVSGPEADVDAEARKPSTIDV